MKNQPVERSWKGASCIIALVIILAASAAAQLQLMAFPLGPDSKGIRTYSEDLLNGRNPYQRRDKALSDESVFPNYMPMLYVTGAAILAVDGAGWDSGTRLLFIACSLAIAALIYAICARRGAPIMGIFGAAFWSFGRFAPMTVLQGHWDNVTLMLLLASLYVFEGRPRLSCILLGLSISFKQSSLIVAPIYVVLQMWRMRPLNSAALIAAIPVLCLLPFIVWDPQSLAQGLGESVLRRGSDGAWDRNPTFMAFGLGGLPSRIPLLIMFLALYYVVYRHRPGIMTSVLMGFSAFIAYSPLLYWRYIVWIMPFIPLSIMESAGHGDKSSYNP